LDDHCTEEQNHENEALKSGILQVL